MRSSTFIFPLTVAKMNYSTLTLTSSDNFSNLYCPNNTYSKFTNLFDHEIHWENCELAISKVSFVGTIYNIHNGNNMMYYVDGVRDSSASVIKFPLETTQITSRRHLIESIDYSAQKHIPQVKELRRSGSIVRRIIDTTPAVHTRTKFKISGNGKFYLHNSILKLLGYEDIITGDDTERPPDIPITHSLLKETMTTRVDNYFRLDPILFFGCDMAHSTHLYGHKKINSLLEVNLAYHNRKSTNEIIEYSPTHLHFFPLVRKDFSSAEISIYTADGELARLVYGPTIVQLTIRDRETTHNQY